MLQLVAKYDLGEVPAELEVTSYDDLWTLVKTAMFRTHVRHPLLPYSVVKMWVRYALILMPTEVSAG